MDRVCQRLAHASPVRVSGTPPMPQAQDGSKAQACQILLRKTKTGRSNNKNPRTRKAFFGGEGRDDTFGDLSRTLATATLCLSPPDNLIPLSPTSVWYPLGNDEILSWIMALRHADSTSGSDAGAPVYRPYAMLYRIESWKRAQSCGTTPTVSRRESRVVSLMSFPSIRTRPCSEMRRRSGFGVERFLRCKIWRTEIGERKIGGRRLEDRGNFLKIRNF
jgi:hypothetical protein